MKRILFCFLPFLIACEQQEMSLLQEPAHAGQVSEKEQALLHDSGPAKRGLISFLGGGRGAATSSLSVDSNGMIQGKNVTYSVNDSLRGGRFPANNPRAIILHKTAGFTCTKKNGQTTVSKGNAKPHIYVCQDGTIVVNRSLDYQRRKAEAGHNDYSINIEFESPYIGRGQRDCARKGHILPPGVLHCYQRLTRAQIQSGREALKLISRYHKIPLKSVIPENQRMNYSSFVNAYGGSGVHKSQVRGVIESYQTRKGYHDNSNHDDYMGKDDMQNLNVSVNDSLVYIKNVLLKALSYLQG